MSSTPRKLTTFERVFLSSLAGVCVLFTIVGILNFFRGVSTLPMLKPIMELTHFDEPEQIGAVLYRRFYVEVGSHPVIVFGGENKTSARVWRGFQEVASREFKIHFQNVSEKDLDKLKVEAKTGNSRKRIIVVSSPDKIKEFQKRLPHALLFFEMPLPLTRAELTQTRLRCPDSQFACWEFAAGDSKRFRFFSRDSKKVSRTKWAAVIMQLASDPNTILVFVHNPTSGKQKVARLGGSPSNHLVGERAFHGAVISTRRHFQKVAEARGVNASKTLHLVSEITFFNARTHNLAPLRIK